MVGAVTYTRPQIVQREIGDGLTPRALNGIEIGIAALFSTVIFGSITIGQIVFGAALSIGLSYLSRALQPIGSGALTDNQDVAGLNAPETRVNERQAIPSKRIIVGEAQVGGALFFEEVKSPYLYHGLLVCAGAIDSIRRIWIGANELVFEDFIFDTILAPVEGPVPDSGVDPATFPAYNLYLQCSLGKGMVEQEIDPLLASDFPELSTSFRQSGIARAVFRYHYGGSTTDDFTLVWGQVQRPNPLLLARGVSHYDPRDPTQLLDDESTWKYTNNAALVQAWYLTRTFGGRIPTAQIVWSKVAEAADYDDELIGCKDGTQIRRYTIDGVITLNQSPANVIRGMLSANRGMILQAGGKVWVSSSRPRTPIATIHDGILTGALEYRAAKPKRDLVNRIKVRFVASEREYQTVDGPILSRTDFQASDGELLDATLELPFTLDHRRAQRLQKGFLETGRLGRQIVCRVDLVLLSGIDPDEDLVGSAVTVDSVLFSQANGTYLVQQMAFADSFAAIELSLVEYDPAIETDWVAEIDEQDFVLADLDVS